MTRRSLFSKILAAPLALTAVKNSPPKPRIVGFDPGFGNDEGYVVWRNPFTGRWSAIGEDGVVQNGTEEDTRDRCMKIMRAVYQKQA